jgi:hypothetical protein
VLDNLKKPFELKIKKEQFNLSEALDGLRALLLNEDLLGRMPALFPAAKWQE